MELVVSTGSLSLFIILLLCQFFHKGFAHLENSFLFLNKFIGLTAGSVKPPVVRISQLRKILRLKKRNAV